MTFSGAAKGSKDDLLCSDLWLETWVPNSLLKHLLSSLVARFYLRAGFRNTNWTHYQECYLHSFSLFPFSLPFWPRLIQSSHGFPLEWLENVSQYFQTVFQQRLPVWGTINTSTRFILAISSSDFQYLTAGWAIKQGVVGKLRIKLWWVELQATSAFPISAKAEQLPLLFLATLFANMWYSTE